MCWLFIGTFTFCLLLLQVILVETSKMPIMTRTKTGTIKRKSYDTITKETAVYKSKATKKTKIYEEADSGETYYTGNRYVPDSMDTIEWSDEETERLLGQCHTQENISVNAIINLNVRCNTI